MTVLLTESVTEFLLAKEHQPATRRYYRQNLATLITWASNRTPPVNTEDGLTALPVGRSLDERKTHPFGRTGKPPSSYSLHATARALLA